MEILVFILIIAFLIFIFHKPGRKPQKGLNAENPSNKLRVKSFTGDEQYMVDINALSCTCADFYDRRSNYDRSDPRRLCKHLIRTLLEEGQLPPSLAQYEEKLQGIEEQGRGFPITKSSSTRLLMEGNTKPGFATRIIYPIPNTPGVMYMTALTASPII